VELSNDARAKIKVASLLLANLKLTAKRLEDETFNYIGDLSKDGFSQSFLSDFLSECGLCTDGKDAKKKATQPKEKAEV